jgi:hypothetical protein
MVFNPEMEGHINNKGGRKGPFSVMQFASRTKKWSKMVAISLRIETKRGVLKTKSTPGKPLHLNRYN